jgi:hypothetical protein
VGRSQKGEISRKERGWKRSQVRLGRWIARPGIQQLEDGYDGLLGTLLRYSAELLYPPHVMELTMELFRKPVPRSPFCEFWLRGLQ